MTEQTSHPGTGPFAGLVVIELGASVAAPFACQILGELGARVIKIEKGDGDDARRQVGATQRQVVAPVQPVNDRQPHNGNSRHGQERTE